MKLDASNNMDSKHNYCNVHFITLPKIAMKDKDTLLSGFSFEVNETPRTLLAIWNLLLRKSTRAEYVPIHLLQRDNILLTTLEIDENLNFSDYCKAVADGMSKAKCLTKVDNQLLISFFVCEFPFSSIAPRVISKIP